MTIAVLVQQLSTYTVAQRWDVSTVGFAVWLWDQNGDSGTAALHDSFHAPRQLDEGYISVTVFP